MEAELLYATKGEVPDDEDHVVPLGVAEVKREGTDVSVITHGKMVHVALQAAQQLEKQDVSVEVVDLRSLRPLDVEAILRSIHKTNRAVYLEEGWPFVGIGAQIVDIIQREAFDYLDAPLGRVAQLDVPMPYNKSLEKLVKPSVEKLIAACEDLLYR
jgi:pyruvate dehydrogenase E1 component beta subunit